MKMVLVVGKGSAAGAVETILREGYRGVRFLKLRDVEQVRSIGHLDAFDAIIICLEGELAEANEVAEILIQAVANVPYVIAVHPGTYEYENGSGYGCSHLDIVTSDFTVTKIEEAIKRAPWKDKIAE